MKMIREADRDNFREVEREWQWEFVFYVLSHMGLPDESLQECLPEDGDFLKITPEHRIQLRKYIDKENVTIVDDHDGGIKIYVYVGELQEHVLVAEWKKCKFVYRDDMTQIDPKKRLYVEVHADVWTSWEMDEEDE